MKARLALFGCVDSSVTFAIQWCPGDLSLRLAERRVEGQALRRAVLHALDPEISLVAPEARTYD